MPKKITVKDTSVTSLFELAEKKRMYRKELAQMSGIAYGTLGQYKNGYLRMPENVYMKLKMVVDEFTVA